ncbi:MAG TPA: dipeptidase [Chloroflexota bacterium]|nr:dipeptidase [Chloroflexota bacterium]
MSSDAALHYARDNRERFLSEMEELLSIPSISTLPEHQPDMVRAARWLCDRLQDMGVQAETVGSEDYPLVYGQWLQAGNAPTVLAYGHYDVQPVDPLDLWTSPPFEPEVRDGNIFARGASDDKGQALTMVFAAESYLRSTGALPLNLKFIIEGQEESGGQVIKEYVRDHGDRLSADVAEVADSGLLAPGVPTLDTGLRGIVYTEIHVHGAAHDLHSGLYGGVAPNALNALAAIIARLRDERGRILIPGFYDSVQMPSKEILESWRRLPFDEAAFLRDEIGARSLIGEPAYTPYERMWARPTLDVHGIAGGFTGEGAKTVIPAEAIAKVSMRIVPNQTVDEVFDLYRHYVQEIAPSSVEVDVRLIHGDNPVVVPEDSPAIRAAREALQATFGRPAVLARSGGSIPIVGIFQGALGLSSVLMGWGLPDDNLHAPNEKFSLENFYNGINATIRFWERLGSSATA